MAAESELNDRFLKSAQTIAAGFQAVNRDGTIPAIAREAVKDLRNTIHEVFFGRGEGGGEPGAPLNPTQGEVAAARSDDMHPYGATEKPAAPLPSPGDIARDTGPASAQGKGWVEREVERDNKRSNQDGNADNAQNEQAKGRSLPDEQREPSRDQGRGR